jgi:hypothetical protein
MRLVLSVIFMLFLVGCFDPHDVSKNNFEDRI